MREGSEEADGTGYKASTPARCSIRHHFARWEMLRRKRLWPSAASSSDEYNFTRGVKVGRTRVWPRDQGASPQFGWRTGRRREEPQRAPREVAYFVPPATTNQVKPSQRGVLTNTAQVWGVVVDEATGLVYASDMNSGLWILRRTDR